MQAGKERNVRNVVAGFEVGSVIGIGTFGEVRYGRHIKTGARVALKIVDLSRFREDTAALLLKEIKILKLLHHKHIISIHDVKDKVPYQGRWCEGCACTTFRGVSVGSKDSLFDSRSDATRMEDIGESIHSSTSASLVCSNCGHSQLEHSAEETRHVLVMVQELAAGGELFGLLMHGGKFNEDIARYYFKQLIAGVEYCHAKGVIHRDLKPENLVLDPNFHLKIVDFGLASLASGKPRRGVVEPVRPTVPVPMSLDGSKGGGLLAHALAREREKRSTKLTSTMDVDELEDEIERDINLHVMHSGVGSQPYSAPEVYYSKELYNGAGYKGQPSDIWSCAVILFVMLTGRPPFLRPLTKTYGAAPNMRRCKHFIKIMQGQGYGNISPAAKELLSGIFKLDPSQRLTMTKIKESAWFNGPFPDQETLAKVMEEKSRRVWAGLDKNEMVEVLRKMRAEQEEEAQHRHSEERIIVRNREIEEDDEIYTRTPRKSIVSSVPLSIKPPTSPLSPRSSAPIPIPSTSTPMSSLLPSPSPLTPSAASPSPLPSFSSVPSSYNPLSEADVNVSLLSLTEEEPIYRSLSHNRAFYSHSSLNSNTNNSTDWEKSDISSERSIPKSFSDFPTTSSSSYHHLLIPSLEKSSSSLRFDSPQKSTYSSSASSSPSNHRRHRRSRKGSNNSLRPPNARSKPSSNHPQRRFPKKFSSYSQSSYLDSHSDSESPFYPPPLYQEAWRALQGDGGTRSGSPSYSDELILRRAHRPIPPRRPSSSASSSSAQISHQKQRQTRSVFSLPHTRGGNIVPIEQHKKRREEKMRHTSFSGKTYGDSLANEQDETECDADEEIIPSTPTIPTLPFASMGIMRGSRFLTWSPLIRLLPTLASRLRAFGCTLICQGLSNRTSRSHREENGLLWTPLAKIRAVYVHSSPLTSILTIFRLSLSEAEKEKEKDEEEKWKETQALLVDCHRVKGDILLWNQLFQQLLAPIPPLSTLPAEPTSDLSDASPSRDPETESSIQGVDHKASAGGTPMKGEREVHQTLVSEELEVEQL